MGEICLGPPAWMLAKHGGSQQMGGASGPLDPLELALLLEAAEELSGLDRDETPAEDEAADEGNEDDQEP
jgi:hypothetical protein